MLTQPEQIIPDPSDILLDTGGGEDELDRDAERVALAAAAPWWDLAPAGGGRWTLLLDASDWSESAGPPLRRHDEVLTVPIGEHPDGDAVWDLRRSPHILVAGATGSGKSSLLRTVMAALPLGWCHYRSMPTASSVSMTWTTSSRSGN